MSDDKKPKLKPGRKPTNPDKPKRHKCALEGCESFTLKEFCRKHTNPTCQHPGCDKRTTQGFCRSHSEKTKNRCKVIYQDEAEIRKKNRELKQQVLDKYYKPIPIPARKYAATDKSMIGTNT